MTEVPALFEQLSSAVAEERPVALATVVEGPGAGSKLLVEPGRASAGSLGSGGLDRVVARDARGELEAGGTVVRHYGRHGEARGREVSVFIESFAPPPDLFLFGAVDFTAALASAAKLLGYRVTVCDARAVFATRQRFPMADRVVVEWPQQFLEREGRSLGSRDAVCVLTHDPKFDVPALVAAVRTDSGYIGAMGSRRTHADRFARLRAEGLDDGDLARICSPVGLDLGARTPAETAVAILAEIIGLRTGRSGGSLRDSTGPLHGEPGSEPVGSDDG